MCNVFFLARTHSSKARERDLDVGQHGKKEKERI